MWAGRDLSASMEIMGQFLIDGNPHDDTQCIKGVAHCVSWFFKKAKHEFPMVLLLWFFIMNSDCSKECKVKIFKSFTMGHLCCIKYRTIVQHLGTIFLIFIITVYVIKITVG